MWPQGSREGVDLPEPGRRRESEKTRLEAYVSDAYGKAFDQTESLFFFVPGFCMLDLPLLLLLLLPLLRLLRSMVHEQKGSQILVSTGLIFLVQKKDVICLWCPRRRSGGVFIGGDRLENLQFTALPRRLSLFVFEDEKKKTLFFNTEMRVGHPA